MNTEPITANNIGICDAMDFTVPGLCAHISAENGGNPVDISDFR